MRVLHSMPSLAVNGRVQGIACNLLDQSVLRALRPTDLSPTYPWGSRQAGSTWLESALRPYEDSNFLAY